LEVAAEERRLTATAVSVACGGRNLTACISAIGETKGETK
jgi:hypothetical protein